MALSSVATNDDTINADSWCVTESTTTTHSFLWTINNFSRFSANFELLKSSIFATNKKTLTEWALELHPRGYGKENNGYVSVFLKLVKSSEKEIKANMKLSVIMSDGKKTNTLRSEVFDILQEGISRGCPKYIARQALFDQSNGFLVDDKLKLYCEVTILYLTNISSGDAKSALGESTTSTLLKDIGALLEDSQSSDVILNVSGKQIGAHKAILSARSPVFAAMLKHQIKESIKNEVDIADISYETMENVLRFIYTGKASNLETMAANLLYAADKYSLEQLKQMCEDVLYSNISIKRPLIS